MRLFCFRFVNSYISLFYIAFFKTANKEPCLGNDPTDPNDMGDCMAELSSQLAWIFMITMAFNLVEMAMPVAFWQLKNRGKAGKGKKEQESGVEMAALSADGHGDVKYRESPIEDETECDPYGLPVEDYLEIVINYGYMVMFSVCLPIIPLLTLIEYVFEIRVDAWKLLTWAHRPFPLPGKSIGVFATIVQVVSYFGAITNPALIMFTSGMFLKEVVIVDPSGNSEKNDTGMVLDDKALIWFLMVEHGLILLKFVLAWLIPDQSKSNPYSAVSDGIIWSERICEEKLITLKGGKQERDDLNENLQGGEFKFDAASISKDDDF